MLRIKSFISLLLLFVFMVCGPITRAQLTPHQVDSLEKQLAAAKEDSNKVKLYMELGNNVGYYDPKKAVSYGKEGYALSRKLGYDQGVGNTAYLLGTSYHDQGEFALGDSFLLIAETQFRSLNNTRGLVNIEHARGVKAYKQGDYWTAADNFTNSTKLYEELKDSSSALIAYQSLIAVLGQTKNHEKAITLGKKALELAYLRKDTLSAGYSIQTLVTDLIYANRLDEAGTYIPALKEITNLTIDQNLAAEASSTIGTYYYRSKKYREALPWFLQSIEIARATNDYYQTANHHNSAGLVYLELGDMVNSKKSLLASKKLAVEYNNRRADYNASLSLSSYYKEAGDYRNAYDQLFHHLELKDSILKGETANYTSYLETSFETSKKEQEILRLKQVQQEKDFALRKRNIFLGIAAGLLLTVILILSLVRKNAITRQKLAQQHALIQEEKIALMEKQQQVVSLQSMINGQETERTRIARDLHDGLGGVFSTVKMHYSTLQQDTPEIRNNSLYKKTLDLINNASDELRKVAHNMMPEVLMKVGLVEALQDFCNNISSGKLLKVTLQSYGMDKRLGSSSEIMLFRIIQELVNNIIKHADATEAIIQINLDSNRLSVVIEDNGRGFDTKEAEERASMGMATVKSRVDYLNGRLTIDSRKDIGTTVVIELLVND